MFISRLALRNFRAYQGTVDILFPRSSSSSKRVYLVGGENGAGKTSLLLALTLGLYGSASEGLAYSAGRRQHERAYVWTLQESFNRAAAARGEESMAVTTAFEVFGDQFEIQREWWFQDAQFIEEDVRLRLNGKPLVDVAHDMSTIQGRQEAVEQLMEAVLPPRAARFFFFDGEEVASLADRDLGRSVIHGLDELLGLDQVHRVNRELGHIERTERSRLQEGDYVGAFQSAQKDLHEAEEIYAAASQALQDGRQELVSAELTLETLQAKLFDVFQGRDVSGIAELKVHLGDLRGELHEISRQVVGLISDGIAVTPSVELLERVISSAEEAALRHRQAAVTEGVASTLEDIVRKLMTKGLDPKLTYGQKKQLQARAAEEVRAIREEGSATSSELSEFTEFELQRIRARASSLISGQTLPELRAAVTRRQELRRAIRIAEADVRTFEQSGTAADLIARRSDAEVALSRARERVERADAFAAEAESRLKEAHARINETEERLATTQSGAAKAAIARRARLALEQFVKEMRSWRTSALEGSVATTLLALLHRQGALADVAIDGESGTVSLFDGRGHEIAVPSAGERELFALSLIKALGQLSNRDAPMVIDTPLGRLDQAHRSVIVGSFLPSAASQVVVLATDSEIYGELYGAIRPHLAWQATLSPMEGGGVQVQEGRYFDEAVL